MIKRSNQPLVLAVDIDAIGKVIDASMEIFGVALKGGGVYSYLTLIDDLMSIVANIKEAKYEIKDGINSLEREILINEKIELSCQKLNVLNGTSKYGIENILEAAAVTVEIVSIIKKAISDGIDISDTQYLGTLFLLLYKLYSMREELKKESSDIQANELKDIAITLNTYITWLLELN